MNSMKAAVVDAINQEPMEVVHRLALADMLEEEGATALSARHRFIARYLNGTHKVKQNPLVKKIKDCVAYPGRKVYVKAHCGSLWFRNIKWDDKTRSHYYGIALRSGDSWFESGGYATVRMDIVVVEVVIFCGQDCGITIHVHPEDLPEVLGLKG